MGVGRFFCVALPFILTALSIIATLIVGLTGVANNQLYLYEIDITNLTIPAQTLETLIQNATDILDGKKPQEILDELKNGTQQVGQDISDGVQALGSRSPIPTEWHDASLLSDAPANDGIQETGSVKATEDDLAQGVAGNITASDLGLANVYTYSLWGMCVTHEDGKKNCTKAEFDWASKDLNLTWVQTFADDLGLNVTVPKGLNDALGAYKTVNKWTEVVFIITIIALALMLAIGLFSVCSRGVSCVVWLISGFASAAIIATAILLTVTASIIVGNVLLFGGHFGAKAHVNTSFLAIAWIGVVLAVGAGLFWLFSACCCKADHSSRKNRHSDGEKLIPGGSRGYAPLSDPAHNAAGYGYGAPQRGGARSDLAYEPYSHSRV